MRPNRFTPAIIAASVLACSAASLAYQASITAAARGINLPPTNWTTEQDHQNMMDQLGIKALRPGPSGNENDPNHANYDESKANPYPNLPDPLVMKDSRKVATPALWWRERRA